MPSRGRLLLCYGHTSTLRAGQSLRGVRRRAPLWCAAGGADTGIVQRSPAAAIEPPTIDPAAVPPDETGPDQPTEQRRVCSAPTAFPNSNFADKPWANDYLRIQRSAEVRNGAGITVAVIDTGVTGSPRVPAEPGGDFVDQGGNGMSDCDSHGTLTASIIAGRPAPTDGFIGSPPTPAFCRCARRRRLSSRSARAPTPMTPIRPRPPVHCAAWPARWCTPPMPGRR